MILESGIKPAGFREQESNSWWKYTRFCCSATIARYDIKLLINRVSRTIYHMINWEVARFVSRDNHESVKSAEIFSFDRRGLDDCAIRFSFGGCICFLTLEKTR